MGLRVSALPFCSPEAEIIVYNDWFEEMSLTYMDAAELIIKLQDILRDPASYPVGAFIDGEEILTGR